MLKVYNTLSKQLDSIPEHDHPITFYSCGPTVYNTAHIGNLRSFIAADVLYRTLKANGKQVKWVMNITDIEDKIIKSTIESFGPEATVENLKTYTSKFTKMFLEDLRKVNVSVADITFINVTDVVPQIQTFILELIDKGYAYVADDGSTYFSIEKYQADFGDYGALVGSKFLEGKKIGARVKVDEYDKDNLSDFALWKAWDQEDANIFWEHETLGKGRPGWHIECSVINTIAFNGQTTDIHTGGIDLTFPHHTNEIAQSQPFYKPFANIWVHSEHLQVENKKMAKSAKNFYILKDIEDKGFSGLDLRYLYLQSHYRTQSNFTWTALEAAKNARTRLSATTTEQVAGKDSTFIESLNNDINTAEALAVAWEHKNQLQNYDEVLGLDLLKQKQVAVPEEVTQLLSQRESARKKQDYVLSDELRVKIETLGFEVLDTKEGQKISKK